MYRAHSVGTKSSEGGTGIHFLPTPLFLPVPPERNPRACRAYNVSSVGVSFKIGLSFVQQLRPSEIFIEIVKEEVVTKCDRLKMLAQDGKMRETDVAVGLYAKN